MSDQLFPSGPWTGFYNYRSGDEQHRMDLNLTFTDGVIIGDGSDDVGIFSIRGRYDTASHECHWTKTYVGKHDVFYEGIREGKGIWGRWVMQVYMRGGFQIWPLQQGNTLERSELGEQTELVDADATEETLAPSRN